MSTNKIANKYWIAVASADHVRRGRSEGFMQVSHGKAAPLKRIKPGDRVVYYSPALTLGGKDKLQSFTAIGTVKTGEPYLFDVEGRFQLYRRDVAWAKAGVHRRQAELGLPIAFRTFLDQRRRLSLNRSSDESGGLVVRASLGRLACLLGVHRQFDRHGIAQNIEHRTMRIDDFL
jgi:hypothetical protein